LTENLRNEGKRGVKGRGCCKRGTNSGGNQKETRKRKIRRNFYGWGNGGGGTATTKTQEGTKSRGLGKVPFEKGGRRAREKGGRGSQKGQEKKDTGTGRLRVQAGRQKKSPGKSEPNSPGEPGNGVSKDSPSNWGGGELQAEGKKPLVWKRTPRFEKKGKNWKPRLRDASGGDKESEGQAKKNTAEKKKGRRKNEGRRRSDWVKQLCVGGRTEGMGGLNQTLKSMSGGESRRMNCRRRED